MLLRKKNQLFERGRNGDDQNCGKPIYRLRICLILSEEKALGCEILPNVCYKIPLHITVANENYYPCMWLSLLMKIYYITYIVLEIQ